MAARQVLPRPLAERCLRLPPSASRRAPPNGRTSPCRAQIMRSIRGAVPTPRQLLVHGCHRRGCGAGLSLTAPAPERPAGPLERRLQPGVACALPAASAGELTTHTARCIAWAPWLGGSSGLRLCMCMRAHEYARVWAGVHAPASWQECAPNVCVGMRMVVCVWV